MSVWPEERVCLFGRTNFRNQRKVFGIKQADRRSHMYILGQTGTGKSTLLETLARQDIGTGQGVLLLDPHGDLVERLAGSVPESRRNDVTVWSPADPADTIGFNPLSPILPARRPIVASFVLDAFKKLWPDFWGPRLEHVFRHALLVLLDQPTATLADVNRLFVDPAFRRQAALRSANETVRRFWLEEFERYPVRLRSEAVAPIQNKVGAFLAHPVLQRIVTQARSSFSLREVMDTSKVLLVNLSRGKLGNDASSLLGSLLLSAVSATALSRVDLVEDRRRDFFVYLDEFQSFATQAMIDMMAELRKYRVGMILAHQHLAQLDDGVREAVLGNAGTTICFRVGPSDATLLRSSFAPTMRETDLVSLPNYHIYVKLMIKGVVSSPFSAEVIRGI